MKRKVLIVLGSVLIVAAVAGSIWWQRASTARQQVAALLPRPPDTSSMPEVFRNRLAATEARAHSLWHAREGIAELSRLYHANGFIAEAVRCYEGLEQLEPDEPRWPHLHATILAGYGDIDPALALWRKVIRLAPQYLPAHLRLGDALLKSNQPKEAAAAYEAALKIESNNAYARLGLARLDLEASRWDAARQRLEQVVNQTNYELGYDLIVSLYERLGLTQQATAIRARAKASGAYRDAADPWLDGLLDDCLEPYRLSLAAGTMRDPKVALALLRRAVEVAPEDVSVCFQLGTFLQAQGQLDDARAELERCTVLAPEFADGWANLSTVLLKQGQATAANRALMEGLKKCPQSPGLHLMMARQNQQNGRVAEAIAEYQQSIRLRPNEADAYVELANLYLMSNREADAITVVKMALEAEPGNPMALGILAYYAISTKNEAEASRWIARVRNQPRIQGEQLSRLLSAYQAQFGHQP